MARRADRRGGSRIGTGVIVLLLLVPSAAVLIDGSTAAGVLPGTVRAVALASSSPAAATELDRARSSLEAGLGPADGLRLSCLPGEGAGSLSCSAPVGADPLPARGEADASRGWSNLTSNLSVAPQPLTWGSMVYDSEDGYVLLFGGTIFNASNSDEDGIITWGNVTSQTWKFEFGNWTEIAPTGGVAPSPREGAMMADDPADGDVVLFGGTYSVLCSNGSNGTTPSRPAGADCSLFPGPYFYQFYLNDTWTYRGGTWTRVHPALSPPGRSDGMMAYDAADEDVVLFGGLDGQGMYLTLGDTWAFSDGAWTDLTSNLTTSPSPRGLGGMAWDASDDALLLFGGVEYVTTPPWNASFPLDVLLDDTWLFQDGVWTNVSGNLTSAPTLSDAFEMASGPNGSVLFFGGATVIGGFAETWLFHDRRWWDLVPALSTAPPDLEMGMAAFDPASDQTLLFGGLGGTQSRCGNGYCVTVQNYTWVFGPDAPTGSSTTSLPSLTIAVSPSEPWVPVQVEVNVSVRGGVAPYTLTLTAGSIQTDGSLGDEDNFSGNAACGLGGGSSSGILNVSAGSTGVGCPGPQWNGSATTALALTFGEEQILAVVGTVEDADGNAGAAQLFVPVDEHYNSSVGASTGGLFSSSSAVTFSVRAWGGVPPYRVIEEFGDGAGGTEPVPSQSALELRHVYAAAGTYYARFTIEDAAGNSQTWSVTVTAGRPGFAVLATLGVIPVGLMAGVAAVAIGQKRKEERSEAAALLRALSTAGDKSDVSMRAP